MKKLYYIFIVAILISCSSNSEEKNKAILSVQYPEQNLNSQNELFFDGNKIILEEVQNENSNSESKNFVVQKIESTIEDITFRAKRIPTELYLKNQDVVGDELVLALSELKGEQLFYFEFEETRKQDLMKKYFESDMDSKVAYLAFDIFKDFHVINSKGDTLEANYTLYERNYHVAPFEKILVSFSNVSPDENLELIYNDELFGKGTSKFSFASETYLQNNIKQPS